MESVSVWYLRTRWIVSEISLVRCAHSFDFWYFANSCVNTVRTHFPWSIYIYLQCYAPYRCHTGKFLTTFWHLFDNFHIRWPIRMRRWMGGVIGIYQRQFAAGLNRARFSILLNLFADFLTEIEGWLRMNEHRNTCKLPFLLFFKVYMYIHNKLSCPLHIYFCSWCSITTKHQRWNIRQWSFFAYDVQGQNIRPASRRARWTSNCSRGSCESYLRRQSHQTLRRVEYRSQSPKEPFRKTQSRSNCFWIYWML